MQYEPHPAIYAVVRYHKGPSTPKPPKPLPPPTPTTAAENLATMRIMQRQRAAQGFQATMFASRTENLDRPMTLMEQLMGDRR
jgi:hypothetical protein